MRYIHFWATTPYCGTDEDFYEKFDDNISDNDIDSYCQELTEDHAQQYEYCINDWGEDDPTEEELDDYYQSCDGGWEEISEEEYAENCEF